MGRLTVTFPSSLDYAGLELPIVEARVDWITATAKWGPRASALVELAERDMLGEQLYGGKFDEWHFQGYRGFQCGDTRWGWGKHGAVVVYTKERAHSAAPDLARLADHWSRIDYCVTVFDVSGRIRPPVDYWATYDRLYPDGNDPVHLQRFQDHGSGETVTLGSRKSATYLRCYDKYHESKGDYAKGCWRWELELKREQAEAAQSRWLRSIVFPSQVAGLVKAWPEAHLLGCPWSKLGNLEPCHQLRHTRDADRTLRWLAEQVQPSVEWVAEARGEAAVKQALRLLD